MFDCVSFAQHSARKHFSKTNFAANALRTAVSAMGSTVKQLLQLKCYPIFLAEFGAAQICVAATCDATIEMSERSASHT